jgi:membrane protease YdiL (CAAX protease family)
VRPKWSWWETLIVNVGTLIPFAIGMSGAFALAQVLEPDPTAENLMQSMTPAWALPYLLFIALAPGFSEEVLFRGYAQRRLTERWGGWPAILITSAIFAIFHIAPHTVLFAFAVGIWLGLMAWRSGSVLPGMIAHAAINGLWNAYNIAQQFEYLPDEPSWVFLGALGIVGTAAFAWSIVILRRS